MFKRQKICTDSNKRYLCVYALKLAVGFHEHATQTSENYLQHALEDRKQLDRATGISMLSGFEPSLPMYTDHSINVWFAPNYISTTRECKITKEVIVSSTSEYLDFGFSDVMFEYEQTDFIPSTDHIDFGDDASGLFGCEEYV